MKKNNVIKEKSVPAFLETVSCEEKGYVYQRVRIDTKYGAVYLYPKYNSREQITLEFVNKDN